MRNLPELILPDYFTKLLSSPVALGVSNETLTFVKELLFKEKSLYALISFTFSDIDKDLRLDAILNSLGFEGFRDRLASAFIYYALNGRYPSKSTNLYSTDLAHFDDIVRPFTTVGNSRGFLLSFYFKMARISQNIEDPNIDTSYLKCDESLIALLAYTKSKIVSIDWLLLTLFLLREIMGNEQLEKKLIAKMEMETILSEMDENESRYIISNLLTYGHAIGEQSIFIKETV